MSQDAHPQFAVIHFGARLHYAVPAALEEAQLLKVLYTDACALSLGGGLVGRIPKALLPVGIRRLIGRRIPPVIPREKVRSYWWPSVSQFGFEKLFSRRQKSARLTSRLRIGSYLLTRKAVQQSFLDADAIYVHPCVSTEAIEMAVRQRKFVVFESISHPQDQLMEAEMLRERGLPARFADADMKFNLDLFRREAQKSSLILAASRYSAQGLIEAGIPPEKIATVPYGLADDFFDAAPRPQPGRILFVGTIGYRKGLPYLAEAARILKQRIPNCDVRAVGPFTPELVARSEFSGPTYVGQVPRDQVKAEFLNADVFAFPTISDGFGLVLVEALRAGLPVVCTPNCADVVEPGGNGFIVPTRDGAALADSIAQIVSNRSLRAAMSERSLQLSRNYTLAAYRDRLVEAIRSGYAAQARTAA